MKVAAIVPTRDEADTIGALVRTLYKFCDAVVVVDYCSTDHTVSVAYEAGALIDAAEYAGIGYAYRFAWDRLPADWWVGHIDAGGSHDPQDLCDMLDLAATRDYDVIVGSRFTFGGEDRAPWRRRVLSKTAAWVCNRNEMERVADWTSGLRVYSPRAREILAAHDFQTSGHAWQIEALWVARARGLNIVEFPITYRPSTSHLSSDSLGEAAGLLWRLSGVP